MVEDELLVLRTIITLGLVLLLIIFTEWSALAVLGVMLFIWKRGDGDS